MAENKKKKAGLSGLLRVKDEARFLRLCVESCVDALDELVIIYQPCADDSPRIIEELAREYPDKITTYFYNHKVTSHNLSDEEIERVMALPEGDTELLATYYNTGLGLCTRSHVIKIDADQVYDTDKLRDFAAAYRGDYPKKITLAERLAYLRITGMAKLNSILDILSERLRGGRHIAPFGVAGAGVMRRYDRYVLKKISRTGWPAWFCGFNVAVTEKNSGLSGGKYSDGKLPPFNGVYDHITFPNEEGVKFDPVVSRTPTGKYGNCVIEILNYNEVLQTKTGMTHRLLTGGFLWMHLDLHKKKEMLADDYPIVPFDADYEEIEGRLSYLKSVGLRYWYKALWREYLSNAKSRSNTDRRMAQIFAGDK